MLYLFDKCRGCQLAQLRVRPKMLSDRQQETDEENQHKKDTLHRVKFTENARGIGLNSMAANDGDALAPPKTSARSTNLAINEDASTIASSTAKGENSSGKKILFLICRKMCPVLIHSRRMQHQKCLLIWLRKALGIRRR